MYNGESSRQSELTHSPRRHRRSQSGNHSSCIPSVLPTTSSTLFEDEPLKLSIGNSTKDFSGECSERFKGHGKGSSPLLPLLSPHRRISMSSMGFCKPRQPLRTSAVRLAAMLVSLCAAIPLLYSSSRSTTDSKKITNVPRTSLRKPTSGPAAAIVRSTLEMVTPDIAIADNVKAIELDDSNPVKETVAQERCESRKRWHEPSASTPSAGLRVERAQCAPLLPTSVLENEGWLVGVHIDRAPTTQATNLRLRGAAAVPPTHRSLPHEYFVRVMGAALEGISRVEPAASVDVVVVSEGMWGGLIDSTGLPMEWDIPLGMCKGLGLSCTQVSGARGQNHIKKVFSVFAA